MSDPEKKKIHNKLTYLKRKILEKMRKFHDFGDINVSLTFQGGSKKDKKFCMPPKPRVGNQPLQEVRILNLKAEISRLCLKFVKSDPPDEERD